MISLVGRARQYYTFITDVATVVSGTCNDAFSDVGSHPKTARLSSLVPAKAAPSSLSSDETKRFEEEAALRLLSIYLARHCTYVEN